MKICIIVDDYLPFSIKVAAKMMHELAVELKTRGHAVTVVTPATDIKNSYEISYLDDIRIFRFKSGSIKNTGKIKRAVNESLLSFKAWWSLKGLFLNEKQDLIIYYSPTIFWGVLVRKLKKHWKAKSFLILRDFFPQWVVDNGMLKEKSIITQYFRFFEKINYNNADKIGIQSPANIRQFQKYHGMKYSIDLLYNWASDKPETNNDFPYRKKLGIENKTVFFYGGNIGHAQDMENILKLAKALLKYENAHFVLIGAGDEVELVKQRIKDYSLTNMNLLDPVDQVEFKKIISEFDIGLFSLHKNHTTHNFPGKVLGYMVQSMPILGCVNPGNDLKDVIEKANAGYVSISGDGEALLTNAISLLDSKNRKEKGFNSKKLLQEKFSISAACNTILKE